MSFLDNFDENSDFWVLHHNQKTFYQLFDIISLMSG